MITAEKSQLKKYVFKLPLLFFFQAFFIFHSLFNEFKLRWFARCYNRLTDLVVI